MAETPKKSGRGGARPGAGRPRKNPEEATAQAEEKELNEDDMIVDALVAVPVIRRKKLLEPTDDVLRQIGALASVWATQEEAASILGVSIATFTRFLANEQAAKEAWQDGFNRGKISLRRKQLRQAEKQPSVAIFLGKNQLGQKDEVHKTTTINQNVADLSEAQLLQIIERGASADKAEKREASKTAKSVH